MSSRPIHGGNLPFERRSRSDFHCRREWRWLAGLGYCSASGIPHATSASDPAQCASFETERERRSTPVKCSVIIQAHSDLIVGSSRPTAPPAVGQAGNLPQKLSPRGRSRQMRHKYLRNRFAKAMLRTSGHPGYILARGRWLSMKMTTGARVGRRSV